jgi:ketosteroid isomerase-like protein
MGRHLDERLMLRAPRLTRRLAKLLLALPPGSPIRRRALKWLVARIWAALSRGDDEVVLLAFDRELEFNITGGGPGLLGLGRHLHGHAAWLEFIALWRAEWAGAELIHTPEALIDLGDRIVTRMTVSARGASSGVDVAQTMGIVSWVAGGAVVRQDNYWEWSECVEALGLDEVAGAKA